MAAILVPVNEGRRILLDKAVIFIGRHPDCDVVLTSSRKVSRRHCCIAQVNNRLIVRDLGSMNGVRINGQRVKKEAPLRLGDELAVGDVRYVLQAQAEPGASAAAPGNGESQQAASPAPAAAPDSPRVPAPDFPVDLSQKFPVPIDDDGSEDVVVIPSIEEAPDEADED